MNRTAWLFVAALAVGCAHRTEMGATPSSSEHNARVELARLSDRVQLLRARIGLPEPETDRVPPRSSPPMPEASPSEPNRAAGIAGDRGGRSQSNRCRDIDAVAGEICHAADRICVLAGQLADDDARSRCVSAREDCRRARALGNGCH